PPRVIAVCREFSTAVRQLPATGEMAWLSLVGTMFPQGRIEMLLPLEQSDGIADLIADTKTDYEAASGNRVTKSGLHVVGRDADVAAEADANAKLRGEDDQPA
ncbi:MAG: hypothetical protein ACRDJ2_13790, partial [Actinomycetota bacterium]